MKRFYMGIILFILLFASMLTGCSNNPDQNNVTGNAVSDLSALGEDTTGNTCDDTDTCSLDGGVEKEINIDKLEIYHFHGTNQCSSCIAVGDYAEATVNTYFKEELEKGIIVFDHINGELPENRILTMQYGATGSSLWLGTYKGEEFSAEQDTNVWYKIRDKQAYMDYLKGVIEQKLAGN